MAMPPMSPMSPPPTTTGETAPCKVQDDPPEPPPSSTDENERPANAPTVDIKVRVPRSDRRVALAAIDDQLAADKAARKERRAAGDESGISSREVFFLKCMDETAESLKRQLEAATVAADGAEEGLESFAARAFAVRRPPSPATDDEDGDDGSLSSVDDDEEEIDFDDNEILDSDAYNQARRLRSQAREVAARVISLREETVGRALDVTRRNLSELVQIHGFSEDEAEGGKNAENTEEAEEENKERDALHPMRNALRTLAASLQNVDSGLTERLESIKETIGTIDSSVEKYQRVSQGDQSALSQTEKALLASETLEGGMEKFLSEPAEDEGGSSNPDRKLARLLAGVL